MTLRVIPHRGQPTSPATITTGSRVRGSAPVLPPGTPRGLLCGAGVARSWGVRRRLGKPVPCGRAYILEPNACIRSQTTSSSPLFSKRALPSRLTGTAYTNIHTSSTAAAMTVYSNYYAVHWYYYCGCGIKLPPRGCCLWISRQPRCVFCRSVRAHVQGTAT